MTDQTDSQLLKTYVERRLEPAFTELVRRHVDFVYSAAIRMVRDPHLAEDVTQGAFIALAKQAPDLLERATLGGWLHLTAHNIACQTVRTIERRRTREQEAVAMNELISTSPEVSWEQIKPHLDAAIRDLTDSDRDAVVLRYFKKKSAVEMAEILGITDQAAQKRVSRAVEKLREFFSKRKITIGAGSLGILISANAVQSAPVGLAATISATVLAGTAVTASIITTATKTIAMTTLQKALITATVAALAGAGIFEARQAHDARTEAQILQEQQTPLAGQIQELQNSLTSATNQLAALNDELMNARKNNAELLKLRGQIGTLKRELAQDKAAQAAALSASGEHSNDTATQPSPPVMRKMTGAKNLVMAAFYDFPDHHGGQSPTNWDQIARYFDQAERQGLNPGDVMPDTAADFNQMTNEFDFVYTAPVSNLYSATNFGDLVVLRGKQPFQTPEGKWMQVYGFADGHSQVMSEPPEGFAAWEQQHMAALPNQ